MPETHRPGSRDRLTYVLSLWKEGQAWRAALRPDDGGPRRGFGNLDQLAPFLLRLQDDDGVTDPLIQTPERWTDEHDDA
jgi:hypothetical protein